MPKEKILFRQQFAQFSGKLLHLLPCATAMPRLILFNKPFGVLCQFRDKDGRPVLGDFISLPDIYPAGRLDHDSEGLLLLTDHGLLQSRISDPRWKLPKTYWVQVDGQITEDALQRLREGVVLNDGLTLPAEAVLLVEPTLWCREPPVRYRASIPTSWLALTIREGRNRQVRRMTAAVGFPTLRLVRVSIGPWRLDQLAPGEWREVDIPEADFPGAQTHGTSRSSTTPSGQRPRRQSPSPPPSAPPHSPTPASRTAPGSSGNPSRKRPPRKRPDGGRR